MKKSAVVAVTVFGVFGMLPLLTACNNSSEQAAYMEKSSMEANAAEAEKAEQEFMELASKEKSNAGTTEKTAKKTVAKTIAKPVGKTVVKTVAKTEKEVGRKPASVPKHVVQTGSSSNVWVVQLGAFRVKENAEKLTAKLKTDGYPVMMHSVNHSKNGKLFVVSLEPTPNRSEAAKWQSDLKAKSFETNVVGQKD